MKISKHYLQRIIKEELSVLLKEQDAGQRFTAAYRAAAKTDANAEEVVAAAKAAAVKWFHANKEKMGKVAALEKARQLLKQGTEKANEKAWPRIQGMVQWIESGGTADIPATGGGEGGGGGKVQPLIDKAMADNKEKIDALLDKHDQLKAVSIVRTAVLPTVNKTMKDVDLNSVIRKISVVMTNYATQRSGKAETTKTEEPAPAAEKVHTIGAGDNLTKIAKKYGVKWRDIAKLNNIKKPYRIHPGQKLKIPGSGPAAAVATTKATVRKGRVAAPSGGPPRDLR